MVYDPIRDCEVPSPATSTRPDAWRGERTPLSTGMEIQGNVNGAGLGHGQPPPPPAFAHAHENRSPSSGSTPIFRSASGGLRGLLNDEAPGSRRSSSAQGSVSSAAEDGYAYPRGSASAPGVRQLLHEEAPPISNSSSASSINTSMQSPGTRTHQLDPDGFLAPSTPASAYPRSSRSPHPAMGISGISPGYPTTPLPAEGYNMYHDTHVTPQYNSEVGRSRGFPPTPQEYFDPSRVTPQSHMLPLRSPSISISPRNHAQPLPTSRPTSSSSNTFSFQPPGYPMSPPLGHRRVSGGHSRPGSGSNSRLQTALSSRRDSRSTPAPFSAAHSVRSPSPIIPRTPYQPHRISEPRSVLYPIASDDVSHLKSDGMSNNPLRRRRKRPLPSWSNTTPGSRSQPAESDNSYFPPPDDREGSNYRSTSYGDVTGHRSAEMTPAPDEGGSGPLPRRIQAASQHLKRQSDNSPDGHEPTRRKVSGGQYTSNVALVANHYNQRQEVGVEQREFSPIIGLKKFNNWIKSVLIGKFTVRRRGGPGSNVLDIGCGKGGDLNKWKQARIRLYVGLDIAATSVEQAEDRYRKMYNPPFDAFFYAHDCFSKPIADVLPDDLKVKDLYDNVSMQFCMHYAFETASKVRMMLENVTRYLRTGALFMGTIPNAEMLLEKLNELPEDEVQFGHGCYYIRFAERRHKGVYGHAYNFFLQDAVEDVPEYLVDWDNFVSLATEYRLKLVYKKTFNEVLQEEQSSRDFGPLLGKMGVINADGESAMTGDQWEAANLYMAFAFEKR